MSDTALLQLMLVLGVMLILRALVGPEEPPDDD